MKKTVIKFAFLSMLLLAPAAAAAEKVTVTVKGMVCSFCAQGIKKTFGKVEDVNSVAVDLEKKTVTLDLKDGNEIGDDKLKEIINNAGYDVLKIERKGSV